LTSADVVSLLIQAPALSGAFVRGETAMTKANRNKVRSGLALSILLKNGEALIGRSILSDDDLVEAGRTLVADLLNLFKKEVERPVTTIAVAGVQKFREEE